MARRALHPSWHSHPHRQPEVASGRLLAPTVAAPRTETDFVDHVARTIALDPEGEWIRVVDNLSTHVSPSLVRFVAHRCDKTLAKPFRWTGLRQLVKVSGVDEGGVR